MFADSLETGVSLAKLFPQSRFHYTRDIRVTSCCADPDQCQLGDLYVALMGRSGDGHFDAMRAVDRGAAAVLTERLLPVEVPQCIVRDSGVAHAALCQQLAGNPAQHIQVVGIAGHRGKTATQMLLTSLLEKAGHQPAVFGRLGYTNGSDVPTQARRATPSHFARWLAEVASVGCSHAVTELARDSVVRHVFSHVPLRMLVLGGLSTSTHRNAPTPKTRTYVQRMLGQLQSNSMVIANIDCPIVRELTNEIHHPVLTVSTEQTADITARRLEQIPSEQTFLIEAGEQTAVVRSRIIGDTHLQSCLLAVAAGLGAGVSLADAVGAMATIETIPGHLERVECGQSFSVFSDAATSGNQLRDSLLTLREVTDGRLVCVFGPGESDRPELRALRGQVVERYADLGIITSDVASETEPLRVAHDVLDGYRKPSNAHVLPNRTRAIRWALEQASPGDTILLAGPHNRHVVRDDHDFPADSDVARLFLFQLDRHVEQQFQTDRPSYGPSWN